MPFVPTGYLTLTAAIDRVVELRQGVDGSPLLTEDERATLRDWQRWRDQLTRPQPKPVTPVPKAGDGGLFVARTPSEKYPHRLVEAELRRPDVTPEEIKDLLEKEIPFKEQQRVAGKVLRQLLYAGQVPSEIITGEGSRIETPQYIWGGGQWHEALSLKNITFRSSILSVTGFPVIPRDALEAAFNSDGTVKEKPEPVVSKSIVEGAERQITTSAAEARCKNWLIELMSKDGPPDRPKPQYRSEAKSQYSVGTRAFDRAWQNAIAETGNSAWSKAGRKS